MGDSQKLHLPQPAADCLPKEAHLLVVFPALIFAASALVFLGLALEKVNRCSDEMVTQPD